MIQYKHTQLLWGYTLMKLLQLKSIFTEAFSLPANAASARKVLKENGKSIVRNDFRCTKTWEQLVDAFGLLDGYRQSQQMWEELRQVAAERERQVYTPITFPDVPEQTHDEWLADYESSEEYQAYCQVLDLEHERNIAIRNERDSALEMLAEILNRTLQA